LVNESISGFKKDGSWEEIVEHGEHITEAIQDEGVEEGDFDDWDEWRPKSREGIDEEMTQKTAEKISFDAEEEPGVKKAAKKVIGTFEKAVYENVMGRSGPLYFDNDLVSARIEKNKSLIRSEEGFAFEVDIHDGSLKEKVRKVLPSE